MQVQDLKRWHWIAAAVVVGLALSYVWSNVEWGDALPTIGQMDFERGLTLKMPQPGFINNVTVLPPQEGKYKVVCEQLRRTKDPKVMEFRPVAFMADAPYKAGEWRGGNESYPTVRDFLSKQKEANSEVKYRYAWYRETWAVFVLWTGSCLLLIGGVWPSVVSLLTGGGLGFEAEEKGPDYDLNRFGKEKEAAKAGKPMPTSKDMEKLAQLDHELEERLRAGATAGGGGGGAVTEQEHATGVQKLSGGPLEAAALQKEEEEKDYKGEFYPVAHPHVPKKDQH